MTKRITLEKGIIGNFGVILRLQNMLTKLGYTLECDGIFSESTKEAVVDFQRKNYLKPTGVVEEATWTVLERLDTQTEDFNPFSEYEGKLDTKNPDILLELVRLTTQKDCTIGVIFNVSNNGNARQFLCFTFEDESFSANIAGKTRIISGNYRLTLKNSGRINARYKELYPEVHKGMIWIRNASGFEESLIYSEDTPESTPGSLFVGDAAQHKMTRNGFVANAGKAYKRIYPVISDSIANGDKVVLRISNFA